MNDLSILGSSLASIIALPDIDAAGLLHERMKLFARVEQIHEWSFYERGVIALQFETRQLWKYLIDPATDQPFTSLTAWISSGQIGARRTTFEAKRVLTLLADVPREKLAGVPKGNLWEMTKLSTAVRNSPVTLEAARRLPREEFVAATAREFPGQHIEPREEMRFNPERGGAKIIEEWLEYAIDHDLAGSRDEALVQACEAALREARQDEEVTA